MTINLFDYLEHVGSGDGVSSPWAARAPRRPQPGYDLKLTPRTPQWRNDAASLAALKQIEDQPWVKSLRQTRGGVGLCLSNAWVETVGAALEAGGSAEAPLSDLAEGERFSVQFWDANATKALHVGHLRNLAIGNALAAALAQAGAHVERRSLICDMGRAMGEAMAGVKHSGRHTQGWPEGDEKSDHFVGLCYADYVAGANGIARSDLEPAEDSLARELTLHNDSADELLKRVLCGDREAVELWYKTRAWVIGGQRKTLSRLGIAFDRVFFESDFLPEAAELTESGLRDSTLIRREDGVIFYATGIEELEELPLVRADSLPTQHMRSLTYCMNAPELENITSLQVCGAEWVSHLACIEKLAAELRPELNGGFHPKHTIFHGMVASQKRALASSEGALLIDDLVEWIDAQIDNDRELCDVRRCHPFPEQVSCQIALGYFLPQPVAPRIDFESSRLFSEEESLGWVLARARGRGGVSAGHKAAAVQDPDYRFAVVQSELYRRYLRLAVHRFDVGPLAHYLKHLAIWYLEEDRGNHVERVVHTLLDRSAHGLGLESAR
jgi:arginyl-tRNA synthetase